MKAYYELLNRIFNIDLYLNHYNRSLCLRELLIGMTRKYIMADSIHFLMEEGWSEYYLFACDLAIGLISFSKYPRKKYFYT
jgi:hypothetical protein